MKTNNLFKAIFGIFLLAFLVVPFVSAGYTLFYFESDTSANSMTLTQGELVRLTLTASSHNNFPVSSEKLEAIQGSNIYLIDNWNEPGTQYGSTYLWTKTYTLDSGILNTGTYTLKFSATTNSGVEYSELTLTILPKNTKPVITLLGDTNINLNVGDMYTDVGATAWDNEDGDLTSEIKKQE